jgi:hypothetical protein
VVASDFTFLIGCGTALHNPSWQSSMGDRVGREDIPAAVTLNSMAFNLKARQHGVHPPREAFGHAIRAGLSYVTMSPNLLKVFWRGFVFGLGAIALLALLPLVARDLIGGGAIIYGLLLGSFGIGAIQWGAAEHPHSRKFQQ